VRGQRHAPAALYPRERPGIHCTGGGVGPRAYLDRCGKSRPPPGFDPRTFRLEASRYTGYATQPTDISVFFENMWRRFKFHLNLIRITATLYEDRYKIFITSRLILHVLRFFFGGVLEKIKTFYFNHFFVQNLAIF
jgi:hypothetical protein